jgi:hypothetical protein
MPGATAVPSPAAMPILASFFAATWFVQGAMAAHLPGLLQAAGALSAAAIARGPAYRAAPCPARTPARTAGLSPRDGKIPRDADCPLEGDGFEPSVPRGAARRCSARKRRQCEVARTSPPSRHDYRSSRSEASWVTTDPARLVVEIIGCRRSLQANSDLFSWRCRVARRPIRENAIRTQTGGTRGSP